MRRMLMILVLVVPMFGCAEAQQPRQQWAVAATAYGSALQAVTGLAAGGVLRLEDAERIEHARIIARSALDQAERILADPRRKEADALFYVQEAARAVAQLAAIEAAYRGAK